VLAAAETCLRAGAAGITVHPRADARHITGADTRELGAFVRSWPGGAEFNIEGDPRPDLLALVEEVRPTQCTLVPVKPGEITSQAGWADDAPPVVAETTRRFRSMGIRVSLFVDPEESAIRWAADAGADRIELYTEPFARAFANGDAEASFGVYSRAARLAHSLHLGVNAGHDLDLENLVVFRMLPHLDEVSIGHALVSHALFVGLDRSVRDYLAVLAG
jgi:pyridoxine 5-phosphate synthase